MACFNLVKQFDDVSVLELGENGVFLFNFGDDVLVALDLVFVK